MGTVPVVKQLEHGKARRNGGGDRRGSGSAGDRRAQMSMISRTFVSVFPRQSPSSLIFSSINAEADSAGTGLFKYSSNSRT
jgi:hypothetical protein